MITDISLHLIISVPADETSLPYSLTNVTPSTEDTVPTVDRATLFTPVKLVC